MAAIDWVKEITPRVVGYQELLNHSESGLLSRTSSLGHDRMWTRPKPELKQNVGYLGTGMCSPKALKPWIARFQDDYCIVLFRDWPGIGTNYMLLESDCIEREICIILAHSLSRHQAVSGGWR